MKHLLCVTLCWGISICLWGQIPGFQFSSNSSQIDRYTPRDVIVGRSGLYYQTPEMIRYSFLEKDRVKLKDDLTLQEAKLYESSLNDTTTFDRDAFQKQLQRIEVLKNRLYFIEKEQDSLFHIYTRDFLQYDKVSFLDFNPARSKAFFDLVYKNNTNGFGILNHTGFLIGNNTGSIYSELVSGYLGIFRVSFSAMVSSSSADSILVARRAEAFQRLITLGGNTALNLEYPLIYIHSDQNQYNIISRVLARGTADFAELGAKTDEWAGSFSLGLDLYGDVSIIKDALRFFVDLNTHVIYGNEAYQYNLGIENANFAFGQFTLGLIIADNLKLGFTLGTFSTEDPLQQSDVLLGGQVLY